MQVQDFLSPRRVVVDFRTASKVGLLRELSRRASEELKLPADVIASALLKREDLGSTGMGNGFAIPHATMPQLKAPYGMLVRLDQPIAFDAIDGEPVDLVFLLLVPEPSQGQPLNALACVARRLRDRGVLEALRDATDAPDMYQKITEPAL